MKELRQVAFQAQLVEVGNEEVKHDILNIMTPDDGQWVYVVATLEEGEYSLSTPGEMENKTIAVKNPLSA